MTDNKEFALWLAKEKKAMADAGYQEMLRASGTVKAHLGAVLVLSVTLAAASLAGAFSQREYSPVCAFLALGFGIAAGLCAAGLYAPPLISKNVGPEGVDGILSDVPTRDEEHASLWLAYTASFITVENGKALKREQRWLKVARLALGLTLPLSCVLALAYGGWVAS
ncbi:MAG: hypothetical protein ABF636_07415 [Acetobacter sp.]